MAEQTGIVKEEKLDVDWYTGTAAQLIAAGLVRADQLPPRGRQWITYQDGVPVRQGCNPPRDERFYRVQLLSKDQYRVWIGLSAEVREQRDEAEAGRLLMRLEDHAQAKRAKAAEEARASLAAVPRTADAFRRALVSEVRMMMRLALDKVPRYMEHGYSLSAESLERAMLSVDAVVEAVMESDVDLDITAHLALVNRHQAAIVAGTSEVLTQLARLSVPNPSLLNDEVQP